MSDYKSRGGIRCVGSIVKSNISFIRLQDFTNEVLADGVSRGKEFKVGKINKDTVQELEKLDITLAENDVILRDDVIIKYVKHTKQTKGATLPFNRFNMLKNIINNPKHIFIDNKRKNLVLVFAGKFTKDRIIKAIVHPNFEIKKKNRKFNKIISIGVIDKRNLYNQDWIKIK